MVMYNSESRYTIYIYIFSYVNINKNKISYVSAQQAEKYERYTIAHGPAAAAAASYQRCAMLCNVYLYYVCFCHHHHRHRRHHRDHYHQYLLYITSIRAEKVELSISTDKVRSKKRPKRYDNTYKWIIYIAASEDWASIQKVMNIICTSVFYGTDIAIHTIIDPCMGSSVRCRRETKWENIVGFVILSKSKPQNPYMIERSGTMRRVYFCISTWHGVSVKFFSSNNFNTRSIYINILIIIFSICRRAGNDECMPYIQCVYGCGRVSLWIPSRYFFLLLSRFCSDVHHARHAASGLCARQTNMRRPIDCDWVT